MCFGFGPDLWSAPLERFGGLRKKNDPKWEFLNPGPQTKTEGPPTTIRNTMITTLVYNLLGETTPPQVVLEMRRPKPQSDLGLWVSFCVPRTGTRSAQRTASCRTSTASSPSTGSLPPARRTRRVGFWFQVADRLAEGVGELKNSRGLRTDKYSHWVMH